MDSLTVTREQFRLSKKNELEYLAQALGNVSGSYTTETISPTAVTLQGTPTLASGADPAPNDNSLRIPSTQWVKRNAGSASATAPTGPIDGQLWIDIGANPPVAKVWDATNNKWVTVGATPADASTTVKGIIQLATAAEVLAGTDTKKAVTPKEAKDHYLAKNIALLTALP